MKTTINAQKIIAATVAAMFLSLPLGNLALAAEKSPNNNQPRQEQRVDNKKQNSEQKKSPAPQKQTPKKEQQAPKKNQQGSAPQKQAPKKEQPAPAPKKDPAPAPRKDPDPPKPPKNHDKRSSSNDALTGFVVGAVVGAVVANNT